MYKVCVIVVPNIDEASCSFFILLTSPVRLVVSQMTVTCVLKKREVLVLKNKINIDINVHPYQDYPDRLKTLEYCVMSR